MNDVQQIFDYLRKIRSNSFQKEMRFYALMRSGQHAVVHWICSQLEDKTLFVNDLLAHTVRLHFDRYANGGQLKPSLDKSILNFFDSFKEYDNLIYNLEEQVLGEADSSKFSEPKNILLIRDPFNLIASRLNNSFDNPNYLGAYCLEAWKSYAKEYLGETNHLPNSVCINYNQWFSAKTYRQTVAQQLGLEFTDQGINYVPAYGYGSSFEGRQHIGSAQKMKVFNRYKANEKEILNKIDEESIDLSRKIFPDITKEIIG